MLFLRGLCVLTAAAAVSAKLTWGTTKFLFTFGDSYTTDGFNISAGVDSPVPGFLLDVSHRIKDNGASYTKTPGAAELFAGLTEVQIEKAVHTCWKTFVKCCRQQKAEKNDYKLIGKIKGRKRAKAKARREERASVAELNGPGYEYLFQWQYQSTDESTVEARPGAVNPLTNNEGTPTLQATRKVWVLHAPAYRLETTTRLLDRLDAFVITKREKAAKVSNRGNTFRERLRGAQREGDQSSLPVLQRRSGVTMIPQSMVSDVWLATAHGQQYNDHAYFADDEEQVAETGRSSGDKEEDWGGEGGTLNAASRPGDLPSDEELEYA
ncbi:hypothetical protein NUW54_g1322 [Trametes sanguinea]|uniref:Uncharacterized protein n=1 Tax=Trametes sanguinea TaxID=158606 RepID=A0ACC1Q9N4_9APHY|nr:hypothetical protein NUW54_g1322 [Trametes sanguinea]